MKKILLMLCALLFCWCSLAAVVQASANQTADTQEILPFENEAQRQLYLTLTAELRCPQCQNQNIADSHAVVAVDMRGKTYELVQQGYSRQQVLDYMIDRYGDFVHYQPPVNRYTVWLWLAPALLLALLLLVQLKRRKTLVAEAVAPASTAHQALDKQLDQIIEQYRSKKP